MTDSPEHPFDGRDARAQAAAQRAADKAYRKASRPWYKKKRFVIPGALVALSIFGSAGGGSDTVETDTFAEAPVAAPAEVAAPAAPKAAAPKPAAPKPAAPKPQYPGAQEDDTVVAAGAAVKLSGWTTTATPLTRTTGSIDDAIICSNVTMVNRDDETQDYNSLSWKLQAPNGSVVDTTYTGQNDLEFAGLAPGGQVSKRVCFDDEEFPPGQFVLSWQPDVFSSTDRGVWLNNLA